MHVALRSDDAAVSGFDEEMLLQYLSITWLGLGLGLFGCVHFQLLVDEQFTTREILTIPAPPCFLLSM